MTRCDICGDIQPPSPSLKIPFSDLIASAQEGSCSSCCLLLDGIRAREEDRKSIKDVFLSFSHGTLSMSLSPAGWRVGNSTPQRTIFFHVLTGQSAPWPSIKEKPTISGDTGSEKALSWAKQNFRTCCDSHHECLKPDAQLPKRVLEIKAADAEENQIPNIKLYVTQGEVAPYICLSHCWGKLSNKAKTIQSTLKEFQSRIQWAALPRTFQEAVTVTQRLGIRYLWIDSLCIVQDDVEDWREESSKMCSVYQSATLTIFATDSVDSRGGLFRKPSLVDLSRKVLDGSTNGYRWEIFVAPDLINIERFQYYREAFPLFSRAWVYQERMLSPRQLHFGPSEVEWKCERGIVSESSIKKGHLKPYNSSIALPAQSSSRPISDWHEIVEHYSSLNLSFESDRLPAVAGIAKRIAESMKCEYLAGLWRSTLLEDLLWWGVTATPRTAKPLAPSWSWVSAEGPVVYVKPLVFLCKIIDCYCSSLGPDSFGQVSSGCLTVSGSVCQVKHTSRLRVRTEQSVSAGEPELDILVTHSKSGETITVWPDYLWYDKGYGRIQSDEPIYLLEAAEKEGSHYSLVLRCIEFSTQIFERVGFLTQDVERKVGSSHREAIHEEQTIHIV